MRRPRGSRRRPRRAGKANGTARAAAPSKPKAGWNPNVVGYYVNPRPPAVTAQLAPELNLERYFAAAAVMGILASQVEEPDRNWAAKWALDMGEALASEARKRNKP